MLLEVPHPTAGTVRLVGPPWKLSPVAEIEHRPPPLLGQHTAEVLAAWLDMKPAEVQQLQAAGAT
jgi:crotonobetainyl-CoA:carnitine CoA-transferase CaiB-like acyl-CoA transferase